MLKSILLFILILTFTQLISQVDSLKNKLLIDGELFLGGSLQTGGLNLLTVKSTFKSNIDYNKINSNTYLQYGFNNTFDNVIQNDLLGYEIISIGKKKRFHPKIAGLYEKSKVKSIENHYLLGVGMGWNVITKTNCKIVLINTISFETKEFRLNKELDYNGIRYSLILNGEYVLLKGKLLINHKFFMNPFIYNLKNNYSYRLYTNILLPISKKISAKTSFDYSNESIVDTGFKPVNTSTTFGLSIKL